MYSTASAPRRRLRAAIIASALVAAALAIPSAASATTYTFNVPMSTGLQNITGVPGDPNASGTTSITMNDVTNTVCASTSWTGIDSPVVAGHIHQGRRGEPENPGVTINLFPSDFVNGVSSPQNGKCTTVPPGEILAIVTCPTLYNTVVHSFNHPVGAIRGQLQGRCIL